MVQKNGIDTTQFKVTVHVAIQAETNAYTYETVTDLSNSTKSHTTTGVENTRMTLDALVTATKHAADAAMTAYEEKRALAAIVSEKDLE